MYEKEVVNELLALAMDASRHSDYIESGRTGELAEDERKRQQCRIDRVHAGYSGLLEILDHSLPGDKREVVIDNDFTLPYLKGGVLAYSLTSMPARFSVDEGPLFHSHIYFYEPGIRSIKHCTERLVERFWKEDLNSPNTPSRRLRTRAIEEYLLIILPRAEETFEWVIGAASDPKRNPEIASAAQQLRDGLQPES